LPLTASNNAPLFYFIEDDILIAPNLFLLGRNLLKQSHTLSNFFAFGFAGVENINGEMQATTHYNPENIYKLGFARRLNVAYALPRDSWNALRALSHTICNHDDQHWDSVVQYLQDKKMIPHWNYAPMFAHVEHIGFTGLNWHYKSNLTWKQSDELFDQKCVNLVTEKQTHHQDFHLQKPPNIKKTPVNFEGWGGWNNPYDINLCLLETLTGTPFNPSNPVKLESPSKAWVTRCETGFLNVYVNFTYYNRDINKALIRNRVSQIVNMQRGDAITGKFRQDVNMSIHYICYEVLPSNMAKSLDAQLVMKNGKTVNLPAGMVLENGRVAHDLDKVPVPEGQTEEWKSQIMQLKLVANSPMSYLKVGCFGFWIKKLDVSEVSSRLN